MKHIGLEEVFKAAAEVLHKHDQTAAAAVAVSDPKASAGCCILQ
jgi:hypothetical protein